MTDCEFRGQLIEGICRFLRPDYDIDRFNKDGEVNQLSGEIKFNSMTYPLSGMTEYQRSVFIEQITELVDTVILPSVNRGVLK